jgi:hypothetical protein
MLLTVCHNFATIALDLILRPEYKDAENLFFKKSAARFNPYSKTQMDMNC